MQRLSKKTQSFFLGKLTSVFISMGCMMASPLYAELAVEPIPNVLSLPKTYSNSWVFVQDSHTTAMTAGMVMVLDVAASSHQYKGDFQASMRAGFVESRRRNELYVAETVYARSTHGTRTDLITIYDKENLASIAEIILPGNKRGLLSIMKGLFRLTNDEQFALVFNFTPGSSVTVVDMDKRKVVNEVPIPGCSLIYPSGQRGFSTLCGNGTLASYKLDKKGQAVKETISEVFNDIDSDPLFMASAVIEGVRYYPSFHGRIQAIDMTSEAAKIKKSWSLLQDTVTEESWRPSGGQLIAADSSGRLYIVMRKNAVDGTHNYSGDEVWVFDVVKKQRIARISLKNGGSSIEVTKGKQPYMVVANNKAELDVYNANNGEFIRTIGGWLAVSPAAIHAAK